MLLNGNGNRQVPPANNKTKGLEGNIKLASANRPDYQPAGSKMVTGYWLVLENGNRLRFWVMSDHPDFETAMRRAFDAANKDRQRWYASEQFPGQKIEIIPGIRD